MLRWPNKFVIITAGKACLTLVGGQITLTWRTVLAQSSVAQSRLAVLVATGYLADRCRLVPLGVELPVAYDFGDNVYYDDDIVYMNGERVATADEYFQQATRLASTAKDETADKTEWLPLGVFALSRGDTGVSNTVLQLAVSKEGVISGTYYNSDTDIARPVKGTVDKETQRAAWTFADGKDTDIVMETGINNLTQDQTEALFHFGKDITQQWLMVRLQEPPAKKS